MSSHLGRAAFVCLPVLASAWGCAQGAIEDASSIDSTLPDDDDGPSKAGKGSGSSQTVPPSSSSDPSAPSDEDPSPGAPPSGDAGSTPKPPPSSGGATKPASGEILISEVMFDPSGTEPAGEWFELYNASSGARALSGLTLVDGGDRTHVIGAGVTIDPGAYVVLARSKSAALSAKVPGAAIAYEYGAGLTDNAGIALANGSTGALYLKDGSTTIAKATYGGWFSTTSASIQLKTLSFAAGANKSAWCVSTSPWGAGSDKGTPGAASDCP
jgi:hypothetical protein